MINILNKSKGNLTEMSKLRKLGFTLAETLITLGIIGVVAALTMPTLVEKHQEQVVVNKLKKFYSTFSQAYTMAVNDYGTLDTWGLGGPEYDEEDENKYSADYIDRVDKFFEMMKPYIKIIHSEKLPTQRHDVLKNTSFAHDGYVLADGTQIVGFWLNTTNCITYPAQMCGDFYVKINNKQAYNPDNNKNVFNFRIYRDKIIPSGATDSEFRTCKDKVYPTHCTGWIIFNGNLDYLHCPDKLGWDKARRCNGK